MHKLYEAVFTATAVFVLVNCAPQQDGENTGLRKAVFGSTYDEIVVETQLAVRPKAPVGGARRAKAVFFRPSSLASGAEVRRVTPTTTSTTSTIAADVPRGTTPSTTPSDGLSYAARVVGVENPMARAKRVRRQWEWGGSPWSGFSDVSTSQAGSQNFQLGPTGFSGSASQTYHLPTGDTISLSFSNGFIAGPEGTGGTNSLTYSIAGSSGNNKTQQNN